MLPAVSLPLPGLGLPPMPPLPALPVLPPPLPDLHAVEEVATQLGTDPSVVLHAAAVLAAHHQELGDIMRRGYPLLEQAWACLAAAGQAALQRCAPVVGHLLVPNPAVVCSAFMQLNAIRLEFEAQVAAIVHEVSGQLAPLTARLLQIAAACSPTRAAAGHLGEVLTPLLEGQAADSTALASRAGGRDAAGGGAGKAAVSAAKSALGVRYAWGGSSPAGFDCSGLTQWAWRQAGVELPRIAEAQCVGQPVGAGELAEGDLVVWDGHVAMYAGEGQIIEAGDPVQLNPLRTSNMGMRFKGFYRPTA